jgi:hypothetical protein
MMIENLIANPDRLFHFLDNNEAKTLLSELGMIDKFSIDSSGAEETIETITGEMQTHYVLAGHQKGHPKEQANAYVVLCIPKTQYSSDAMHKGMQVLRAAFRAKEMVSQLPNPTFPFSSDKQSN